MKQTIFQAAGGRQAFIALAHAWHVRCMADPIVSHALSHGFHPQHTERLAAYWAEALGGPHEYSERMGSESQEKLIYRSCRSGVCSGPSLLAATA